MAARRFPFFSSRSMRPRENAISAVSLPAKKNDSRRQARTRMIENQSNRVIVSAYFFSEKGAHLRGIDITFHKSLADAAHQDEGELAARHLLVLGNECHQPVRIGAQGRHIVWPRRQADRCKMMRDAAGVIRRHETKPGGELERANDAERDRLTMQQLAGEPRRRLEGVAESVAEIEQRALAGLALVARDDPGFAAACDRDRMLTGRTAREHILPIHLEPGKETRIAEQAEFRKLGVAGAKLARWQGVEQRGVGDDEGRLMERADKVLAVPRVDRGLAADRGIDLRQQCGWHLHDIEPAAQDRRGKAGEIADYTAAERDHHVVALDTRFEQPVAD